jgi:hypothetical protein
VETGWQRGPTDFSTQETGVAIVIRSTDKSKGERIDGSLVIQIRQRVKLNLESSPVSPIRSRMKQLEFDSVAALGAARKSLTLQKGDFMRKSVLLMTDFVNSAVRNLLSSFENRHAHGTVL